MPLTLQQFCCTAGCTLFIPDILADAREGRRCAKPENQCWRVSSTVPRCDCDPNCIGMVGLDSWLQTEMPAYVYFIAFKATGSFLYRAVWLSENFSLKVKRSMKKSCISSWWLHFVPLTQTKGDSLAWKEWGGGDLPRTGKTNENKTSSSAFTHMTQQWGLTAVLNPVSQDTINMPSPPWLLKLLKTAHRWPTVRVLAQAVWEWVLPWWGVLILIIGRDRHASCEPPIRGTLHVSCGRSFVLVKNKALPYEWYFTWGTYGLYMFTCFGPRVHFTTNSVKRLCQTGSCDKEGRLDGGSSFLITVTVSWKTHR